MRFDTRAPQRALSLGWHLTASALTGVAGGGLAGSPLNAVQTTVTVAAPRSSFASPDAPSESVKPSMPGGSPLGNSGGGGFSLALFAVLIAFALIVPELGRRLQILHAFGRPLPFVFLLERPG